MLLGAKGIATRSKNAVWTSNDLGHPRSLAEPTHPPFTRSGESKNQAKLGQVSELIVVVPLHLSQPAATKKEDPQKRQVRIMGNAPSPTATGCRT